MNIIKSKMIRDQLSIGMIMKGQDKECKEKENVALGKSAAVLIICFLLCNNPISIWTTLSLLMQNMPF